MLDVQGNKPPIVSLLYLSIRFCVRSFEPRLEHIDLSSSSPKNNISLNAIMVPPL